MAEQSVPDTIKVIEEHRMLFCQLCQQGIRPGSSITNHFRSHQVKGKLLLTIRAYYEDAQFADPTQDALPADCSRPVPDLPVLSGFSCTQCRYLTRDRDNMTRHWRTARHEGEGERSAAVKLQSWCWRQRRHMRYWVVSDGEGPAGTTETAGTADVDNQVGQDLAAVKAKLAERKAARVRRGDGLEGLNRDSGWMTRTGWTRHFSIRDLLPIANAAAWVQGRATDRGRADRRTEEAMEHERQQLRLGESFDRVVDRCCWRFDSVPRATLQRLGGITAATLPGMPLNGQPFGRKGLASSTIKYQSTGHRYLGFCLQSYRLGREQAGEALAAAFTDEQWGLLVDVVYELEAAAATLGAQSPARMDNDTSSEDDGDKAEGDSSLREGPDTGPLDQAVLQLLASSVRQELGGNVYESPLLCFTAAAGIRKTPLGYAEPHLYTGLLAGVLWWSRAVFLEVCFASQPRELEEVNFDALEAFDKEHARWMCAGTHTVIGEVIGLMAYGKGCRRNMAGQASIRWEPGHGALVHSGDRIAVDDVKRTARGLVTDAELLLDQLLSGAWEKERGRINLRRIRDDMARRGAGDSFATRPENEWLGSGPDKVVRLAGSSLWDAQQSRYKPAFLRKWMKRLRRFREQLIVAVHVWGGQPGRGPELATLRHADSLMLLRNIFVLNGMVAIITDRDKMKSIRGQGRKVARFVPERLGKMVVAYVAWLLPAEEALAELCGGPRPRADELEFMWRHGDSRVWDSARASTLLARTTHAGIGVRLGLMRYRVVAIELGRQIRGLAVRQLEASIGEEDDDDDAVELDPVTGEPVDCGGGWDVVWDLQATHGTRVAQQHYAVHLGFPGQLTEQMIETYRQISQLWHQFLEHDPAPGRAGRGARASWEAGEKKRLRAGADDKGLETDILAGLRRLLGAGATWRSDEQAVAAQTILGPRGQDESVIVVLPTGGGKSLLFMLPAVMRDTGTSIVVVPFVALAEDLVDRALLAGVDCIQFRSSSSSGREGMLRVARLVVVSAETAIGAEFAAYADALAGAGQLGRVFVDECHTIITDQGYRAKLGELRHLHRFGRPLVMLTATLPVPLEDWFRRVMLATSAIIVRGRTTKANCGYRVLRARPGKAVDFTVKAMQRVGRDFTGSDKGVVYCRSRDECEAVAEAGGYAAHHSGMTEEERTGAREAWAGGAGPRWIAATTGLGTGIDIQGVVAVLHLGAPYGLVDFAQQTGRGGRRDGEYVYSAIVDEGGRGRGEGRTRGFVEEVNTGRMAEFMRTPGCRRAVLSSFMDGVEGETCGDVKGGAVACDQCVAALAAAQGQGDQGRQARWAASEGRRARQGEAARRWLDEVDGCAVCDVMQRRGEAGRDHEGSAAQCTPVQWQEVRRLGGGRIETLCGCYQCRLPLDWCAERRGAEPCTEPDRVTPVALMAAQAEWVRELVDSRFSVNAEDDLGAYVKWLTRGREFHGTKGTNALAVWEEVIYAVYKGDGAS